MRCVTPLLAAALAQLEATHGGYPWYGPSRMTILADVTAAEARTAPVGGGPSLWALVLHMTAWTEEVARRLGGGEAAAPHPADWPPLPTPASARAWAAALRHLERAHAEVLAVAGAVPEARWAQPVRWADGGHDDTTHADTLIGLSQHDAYHVGQLASTRRTLRAAAEGTSRQG